MRVVSVLVAVLLATSSAGVRGAALASPAVRAAAWGDAVKSAVPEVVLRLRVIGRVIHEPDGYFVQGNAPSEIFRVLNPDPRPLEELARSGRMVELWVRVVQGDNVVIETVEGRSLGPESGAQP